MPVNTRQYSMTLREQEKSMTSTIFRSAQIRELPYWLIDYIITLPVYLNQTHETVLTEGVEHGPGGPREEVRYVDSRTHL